MLDGKSFTTLLIVCFLIGSQCVVCFGEEMPTFVIRHKLSGKLIQPHAGGYNPDEGIRVVLSDEIHSGAYFKFDRQDGHWGYIVHVATGKCIHPTGGRMNPDNGNQLFLHSDRHAGAFFAIDQTNNYIVHKGGKYAHPFSGNVHTPPNDDNVVLHSETHDGMKFEFVTPFDWNQEVYVYGEPRMVGTWKIINMVLNPRAEHVDTMAYKVGKSQTESTQFSFTYRWEASGGINFRMFSASVSQSLEFMLSRTSSTTWSSETTRTRQITVSAGQTVVTWQYVYEINQNDHRGVYRSNIIADTDSEQNPPRELGGNFEVL